MTAEQETELLAKLERIATALEAQNAGQPALASVVERIACALEREPASPPIAAGPLTIQAKGTK